jgi:2-phospho-L-lactate transferase/gluconeogenesis factor (CofD/UPF0052 family)
VSELRYTVEYDHRVGLYRWQIAPGQQLLPPPVVAARRFPRLVALGGGAGLAILLQGLEAALSLPGSAWLPGGGRERLTAIEPDGDRAVSRALGAIEAADLIVLGPARLHASLIAVLRAKDIAEAIGRSKARGVLVMNLMTELGQTDGYTATDHLLAIRSHAPAVRIHDVLFNTAPLAPELRARYAAHGRVPVATNVGHLLAHGCRPIGRDLLGQGPMVRHDPAKLARAVLDLVRT